MTIRNNPNISKWEWDSGYKGDSVENEYPLRVIESGPQAGLEMSLIAHEQDHTSLCTANEEEFEVILSVPGESRNMKNSNEFNIQVPISTDSLLSMEPELTITSEALRSYSPNQRGCFYNFERRLAFFEIYSYKNCIFECLANYTALHYGCVPFFMPRTYLSNVDLNKLCIEVNILLNHFNLINRV